MQSLMVRGRAFLPLRRQIPRPVIAFTVGLVCFYALFRKSVIRVLDQEHDIAEILILEWDRRSALLDHKPASSWIGISSRKLAWCPCLVTKSSNAWKIADVILVNAFYLRRIHDLSRFFPKRRNPVQRWVFYQTEPAQLLDSNRDAGFFPYLNGQFNLTMTYRLDPDIPVKYGYVVPDRTHGVSRTPPNKTSSIKTAVAAWFVINCDAKSGRMERVRELQEYITVDISGKCGKLRCDGDCYKVLDREYHFYLALESSICVDDVTEKFFDALQHDVVPVVLNGARVEAMGVPVQAYINVQDFPTVKNLADHLLYLTRNQTAHESYFKWKDSWRVKRETYDEALCKLCDKALALKGQPTSEREEYRDMTDWWHAKGFCRRGSVLNGTRISTK